MFDVKGSIVALITPFHEDGSVNFEKLKELCEWHIQNATDALLILGTTGESSTMTHEEDDAVVKYVLSCVQGRVPVIVGSGSNCTQTMIEKSVKYANMGADALLVISPYYNKTNTQGMIQHFTAVADAVNKPLILSKHPNIVGIKEASGNISYAANIARYLSDDFVMYSGNDDMIVPMLSLGASGVISVLANVVPKQTHDMVMDYLQGNTKKACAAQLYYLDLIHALFCEVNPIPVKEALNIMGKEVGGYRLPLYEMSDEHKALLKQCMQEVGL